MFGHRSTGEEPARVTARLAAVERELAGLRRELTEVRAAHEDALGLALHAAVPNIVSAVLDEAREAGWWITYERRPGPGAHGTIKLTHPTGGAHDCSIDLPLPESETEQSDRAAELRMRIRLTRAA